MPQNDSGFKSFVAGEALAMYRCVRKDSSGNLVYADDEEDALGVTQNSCDSGTAVTIKLMNSPGTFLIETSAAVSFSISSDKRGTPLYIDNDGKVSTTGTLQKFAALEGGTTGAYIECVAVHNKFGSN